MASYGICLADGVGHLPAELLEEVGLVYGLVCDGKGVQLLLQLLVATAHQGKHLVAFCKRSLLLFVFIT